MLHCFLLGLLPVVSPLPLLVTVRYPSEAANGGIYLRGGRKGTGEDQCGLSWGSGVPLKEGGKDEWTLQLECEENAIVTLEMKALINDEQWSLGANHRVPLQLQDYPKSEKWKTILPDRMNATSTSTSFAPWFGESQGSFSVLSNVVSKQFENERDVIVYVPPGYNENPYLVPSQAVIMHDGQNLFDPSTAFGGQAWMVQDTVDPMIIAGRIPSLLIIGVYNTGANRINEYTNVQDPDYGGGNASLYLDFLEDTVLPLVEENFRLPALGPETLGTIGSSLGGLLSCFAAATRPEVYGKAGCMSPSFWWASENFRLKILPQIEPASEPDSPMYYLDSGDQGGDASSIEKPTQAVRDSLEAKKDYQLNSNLFYYLDHGGDHNEKSWGSRFAEPMAALYGQA